MLVTDGGSCIAQCTVKMHMRFKGVGKSEYSPTVPANVTLFTWKTQTNKILMFLRF